MGLFENILSDKESLFLEPMALDFDYQPQRVLHREQQQEHIALCIKPLFQKRNGINIIIAGTPGIGKTVCLKHILKELENETSDIHCIYVNCWKKDTAFKVILQICENIGFTWTHNKSYDELINKVTELLNKKSAVIVLDEIDRLQELKILYTLLDDIFRKTLILITNNPDFNITLDRRIKSRLTADTLEFETYSLSQIRDILLERVKYAFVPNIIANDVIDIAAQQAYETGDVRVGLNLLKSAGEEAENQSSRSIQVKHLKKSLGKIDDIRTKKLTEGCEAILNLIKRNPKDSILTLYEKYKKEGGMKSYRTFHRRLEELKAAKLIAVKDINKGFEEGRTNEVEAIRRLDEF